MVYSPADSVGVNVMSIVFRTQKCLTIYHLTRAWGLELAKGGDMREDIRRGQKSPHGLRDMLEKDLAASYGVSRDTCRSRKLYPLTRPALESASIILRSNTGELSNNIIQKELAFGRDWSGTVANSERVRTLRDPAPPAGWPWWGFGDAAPRRHEPNGASQCQSLRKSDQLHHRQRRSLRQSPRNNPLPTPRVSRPIPARNNLA
jgi:hypothetical protein